MNQEVGGVEHFSTGLLQAIGSDRTVHFVDQWDIIGLIEQWHGPHAKKLALKVCDDPDFWRNLPINHHAQHFVHDLQKYAGENVWVVTSPWWSCREWYHARTSWLWEQIGIPSNKVIATPSKQLVTGSVFVDDKPEHLQQWAAIHDPERKKVLLADAAYNRSWPDKFERIQWVGSIAAVKVLELAGLTDEAQQLNSDLNVQF